MNWAPTTCPGTRRSSSTRSRNYSALKEPYFTIDDSVNGTSVRQSKWVDWNRYVDELSFAQAFRKQFVSAGFPSDIGMMIDTSRNGWPARRSTTTRARGSTRCATPATAVLCRSLPIRRQPRRKRMSEGGRPHAPAPPAFGPIDNGRNGNSKSGALPGAPLSGHGFSARFQQLLANAYPPL
ncbi:glycoside hydrolase family 6 protein [Amycolatopsis pigmentata]|uniref:Glycoside hydrolase family 6 protein n=1 Tax=Amycolatopsis pigmentata TaxID=450801 RepID=A0ABW5FXQ5_9PSEU